MLWGRGRRGCRRGCEVHRRDREKDHSGSSGAESVLAPRHCPAIAVGGMAAVAVAAAIGNSQYMLPEIDRNSLR
jgi:hypothetical protein